MASRTLEEATWNNSTLLRGDLAEQVRQLKSQGGPEIQVHGSGNLIQTLMKHDLVDRYQLWVFPLVLGKGKRLFADGTVPAGLTLNEATTSSTGVVMATYEPAGEIRYGSFALEEPTEAELARRERLADA